MLTNDEDLGDTTAATSISFYLLLHLFLRTKNLKYAVTSVVNWYTVSHTKLTEVAQSFTEICLLKMEVSTCKYEVQVLCFQYILVPICAISPYLLSHIGLKLLVLI